MVEASPAASRNRVRVDSSLFRREPRASAGGSWTLVQRESVRSRSGFTGSEKIVCLEKVATGLLFGALKRSFPRINAGAPSRKRPRRYAIESLSRERLRPARMRFRETVGAPCFSRGKLDFSPAEKRALLRAALAAEAFILCSRPDSSTPASYCRSPTCLSNSSRSNTM